MRAALHKLLPQTRNVADDAAIKAWAAALQWQAFEIRMDYIEEELTKGNVFQRFSRGDDGHPNEPVKPEPMMDASYQYAALCAFPKKKVGRSSMPSSWRQKSLGLSKRSRRWSTRMAPTRTLRETPSASLICGSRAKLRRSSPNSAKLC